jgi:hypothetical protein
MLTERQMRIAMRNGQPKAKSGMDAIDLEAEAHGNARRFFKQNDVGPANLGRRISRESRKANGIAKTADKRATDNMVKDTAEAYRRHVVPSMNLRQN